MKPARVTATLYEQMRSDDFQLVGAPRSGDPNIPPRVIDHLKQLRSALKEFHGQVHQDIKAVDAALDEWR